MKIIIQLLKGGNNEDSLSFSYYFNADKPFFSPLNIYVYIKLKTLTFVTTNHNYKEKETFHKILF